MPPCTSASSAACSKPASLPDAEDRAELELTYHNSQPTAVCTSEQCHIGKTLPCDRKSTCNGITTPRPDRGLKAFCDNVGFQRVLVLNCGTWLLSAPVKFWVHPGPDPSKLCKARLKHRTKLSNKILSVYISIESSSAHAHLVHDTVTVASRVLSPRRP